MERTMDNNQYDKYKSELTEELELSDFNMKDLQMKLPGIKHKWVARLIDQKIELGKLKKLKTDTINTVSQILRKENVVVLSDAALAKQAEKHELVKKILDKIEETEYIIDYLERVEKVCSSTSYDIKNLIELKKMELS